MAIVGRTGGLGVHKCTSIYVWWQTLAHVKLAGWRREDRERDAEIIQWNPGTWHHVWSMPF